jgi:hypothetical protein
MASIVLSLLHLEAVPLGLVNHGRFFTRSPGSRITMAFVGVCDSLIFIFTHTLD